MKFNFIIILTLLTSCNGQTNTQKISSEKPTEPLVTGDTVSQLSNNIMVIYQDKKNNYWFGSWQDGLYKYNGNAIIHFTTNHGLPDNRIEEIKEDEQGNVFINTRAGLCKYDGKQFISISVTLQSMSNWNIQPNDLWFKSTKHGHVSRYDGISLINLAVPKNKIGEKYLSNHPDAFDPYGIYCIYKDSKGNIWFGTAVMGAFRYNGKTFDWISESDVNEMHNGPANGVRSIIEDKDGYFWFNTEYKYNIYNISSSKKVVRDSTLFYERINSIGCLDGKKNGDLNEYQSIIKDDKDNLWIAIYLSGVWKVEGDKIKHYPIQVDGKNIPVFYLYKDNRGEIWLGTEKNGAFKFNGQAFEKIIL